MAKKSPEYKKVGECLYRNVHSGMYYALLKRSGKQIRKSLKTKDRKFAERRLVDFKKQVDRFHQQKRDKQTTFKELSLAWHKVASSGKKEKTNLRRKNAVDNLNRYLSTRSVAGITTKDCEAWQIKRCDEISASTYNKERDALIAILDMGVRDGLLLDNPATNLTRRKLPKTQIIIPTKAQFDALVEYLEKNERTLIASYFTRLLARSGMRHQEAISLRWMDIDFALERFTVTGGTVGTKNHEVRVVPLFPAMKKLLIEIKEELPYNPKQKDEIIPTKTCRKAINGACEALEFPHFNHHCMRHFFVSNAIEVGVDFKTIAAWIGHKDGGLLVAKTYGHLRDTHSAEMAERMQ